MKFGVVVFPGSNCDRDAAHVLKDILRQPVRDLWHKETSLKDVDCVILPGGFSYGDYLRTGAIARFSPIMTEVIRHANRGGLVLGICNGFQILCESGLLPGVLMRNANLQFICRMVSLSVENNSTRFTRRYAPSPGLRPPSPARGEGKERVIVNMPIAHGDGNYFADQETLKRLEGEGQVVFRYDPINPNGAIRNIAGIINEKGNVLGMMPHPERCSEKLLGNQDGKKLFESLLM